ncbi:MAG TPA: ABC transporter ATP-binding protein [Thermomicrobiales bacterium]|nr:ABC transporter ATP-binding protein [Thermomicrobiales bacterium]
MAELTLNDVVKRYGEVLAVNRVSLTIRDGEFVSLVGPSGCGKTTTLNMIAGLIELSEGQILIGDRDVTDLDPKDRDIAMVFQNYALYPNKTVYNNLAFPLQMRGMPKGEIAERVRSTADVLSIGNLLGRRPRELSGGQQQRVALGRALVRNPKVFLMDEPLSNLDAKLRVQMRAELKRFHQELHATVVYVTHDQMEAMTMSDRIAVMNEGVLQQAGTPDELFHRPANLFVAGFIGSPAMNFVRGRVAREGDAVTVRGDGWDCALSPANGRRAAASNGEVVLGARHGAIRLYREAQPGALVARVYTVEPTGDITYVHVRLGEHLLVASAEPDFRANVDEPIWLDLDQERLHLFDAATEAALPEAERVPA